MPDLEGWRNALRFSALRLLQNLIRVWNETNNQDQALVERNQRGVNSLGYQPGPCSQETEVGVIKFVEWYCATMAGELEGAPQRSPTLVA